MEFSMLQDDFAHLLVDENYLQPNVFELELRQRHEPLAAEVPLSSSPFDGDGSLSSDLGWRIAEELMLGVPVSVSAMPAHTTKAYYGL